LIASVRRISKAERAILGSILVNNDRLHDIGERIKPGDFYRAAHQKIFEVMRGLSERGEAIDFVTVKTRSGRRSRRSAGLSTWRSSATGSCRRRISANTAGS
jgi:replicative DNA helicase